MKARTALVVVAAMVVSAGGGWGAARASARRHINLPGRLVTAPFSEGVLVGDTLHVAGRLGLDPATGRPPADAEAEARLLLDGMKAILAEARMEMDDLVSVQVFCTDLSLFETWNGVYRGYFKGDPPARAFVGAGSLLRGARFEALGVAVRR